jgi:hypothetical protein
MRLRLADEAQNWGSNAKIGARAKHIQVVAARSGAR